MNEARGAGGILSGPPTRLGVLVLALRPYQWLKNALVLAPLLLALPQEFRAFVTVALAALCVCLASSAGYLVNDALDREADAAHPWRAGRAVASGRLSSSAAVGLSLLLYGLALAGGRALGEPLFLALSAYAALALGYSLVAKHWPFFELFVLGLLFAFRPLLGTVAVDGVTLAPALGLGVLLIGTSLAASKRLAEVTIGCANADLRVYARFRNGLPAIGFAALGASLVLFWLALLPPGAGLASGALLALALLCFGLWIVRLWWAAGQGRQTGGPLLYTLGDPTCRWLLFLSGTLVLSVPLTF